MMTKAPDPTEQLTPIPDADDLDNLALLGRPIGYSHLGARSNSQFFSDYSFGSFPFNTENPETDPSLSTQPGSRDPLGPVAARFGRLNLNEEFGIDDSFLGDSSDSEINLPDVNDEDLMIHSQKINHQPRQTADPRTMWENYEHGNGTSGSMGFGSMSAPYLTGVGQSYPRYGYSEMNHQPLHTLVPSGNSLLSGNDYGPMASGYPSSIPNMLYSPFPSYGAPSSMGQLPISSHLGAIPNMHLPGASMMSSPLINPHSPSMMMPSTMLSEPSAMHSAPNSAQGNMHQRKLSTENFPVPGPAMNGLFRKPSPPLNNMSGPMGYGMPARNNPSPPFAEEQEANPAGKASGPPCRYYANGYCSRGDRCNYAHIDNSLPAADDKPNNPNAIRAAPAAPLTGGRGNPRRGVRTISTPTNLDAPVQPAAKIPIDVSRLHSVEQVAGQIYRICKDQHGCRFLQKKLEEKDKNPLSVDIIFDEVYDHMVELMTDPFGNYLCQKLIEHCNEQQQLLIIQKVAPNLVSISKNMHGTRAVQKMIECLHTPAQVQLVVNSLRSSVVQLIQDLNGNHVIQRCLHKLSHPHNQFVYDAVASNCVEVATHRHGCCVMQRCIDFASNEQKLQLVREIAANALTLVQDPFGNYVVQYVLELPFSIVKSSLIQKFCGHLSILSTQKFSSNVIEKCLHVAEEQVKVQLVDELMNPLTLNALLQDPYGNYVIQTALTVAQPQQKVNLIENIKPLLPALGNTPYGKRIQNKIAKDCVEA